MHESRRLGDQGPTVFPIGLGSSALADGGDGVRVIHEAIDGGVDLIDTADFYLPRLMTMLDSERA